MRYFEKISFNQFKKDISNEKNLYENYSLPKRDTKYAAGYDIYSLFDFVLKPTEIIKIPTGIKVNMNDDEVLLLVDRSSHQVGVIDKDYYNNKDNEGHIFVKLQNEGDKDYIVKRGDAICQGLFVKYLTVDDEEEKFKTRESDY